MAEVIRDTLIEGVSKDLVAALKILVGCFVSSDKVEVIALEPEDKEASKTCKAE